MTNHPNLGRKHRSRSHMEAAGKMYPAAFSFIDSCRADKGKGLPDWPDWCFAPLAASYAAVCQDSGLSDLTGDLHLVADVARIAAIAAWRPSQGIYRFDHDLYQSIIETPISGDLPSDVLHYLPEWSQYIESPGLLYGDKSVFGFWAHLEFDINTERHELRLLLDMLDPDGMLVPFVIHMKSGSLAECIESVVSEATRQAVYHGKTALIDQVRPPSGSVDQVAKMVSLVLYLCSDGADYQRAIRPQPKRTKSGWRLFAVARNNPELQPAMNRLEVFARMSAGRIGICSGRGQGLAIRSRLSSGSP